MANKGHIPRHCRVAGDIVKSVYGTLNTLIPTLKLQSNGPLYSNTVIGTLAVDGWAVTFGTARKGPGRAGAPLSPLTVPNVTTHPSTASVPTLFYLMCVWTLKG